MSLMLVLIWFNWYRTRSKNKVISRQKEELNTALKKLQEAQKKLVAIEEYRKTRDELQYSERKFAELVNLLPQAVFEITADGTFTFANRFAFKFTGYNQADIDRGLNVFSLFHPDEHQRIKRNMEKVLTGDQFEDHEYQILRKDGGSIPALIYSSPIVKDNHSIGIRGVALDVTQLKQTEEELRQHRDHLDELIKQRTAKLSEINEQLLQEINARKSTEEALRTSEERLSLSLESAGLALWDHHFKTNKVVRSGYWAEMLGYQRGEISADVQSWKKLIHPDDLPLVEEAARNHEAGLTKVFSVEHRLKTKDGQWKWILNWGRIVERDIEGNPVRALGTHMDISDLKKTELSLRVTHDRMESMLDALPDLLFELDREGRILEFRAPSIEMLYLRPNEFLGKTVEIRSCPPRQPVSSKKP